jgi:hypothetical protein
MRIILICLIALFIIGAGCTGSPSNGSVSCNADKDCASWQSCNTTSKQCVKSPGFCESNTECSNIDPLMSCDALNTHKCVYTDGKCRSNANCESWQVCDSTMKCRAAPSYCDNDNQCDRSFEFCHPNTHRCAPAPGFCQKDTDCDSWKSCDVSTKRCATLPGRCDLDGDCENYQSCDSKTHMCKPKVGFCINDDNCDSAWSRCDLQTAKLL